MFLPGNSTFLAEGSSGDFVKETLVLVKKKKTGVTVTHEIPCGIFLLILTQHLLHNLSISDTFCTMIITNKSQYAEFYIRFISDPPPTKRTSLTLSRYLDFQYRVWHLSCWMGLKSDQRMVDYSQGMCATTTHVG